MEPHKDLKTLLNDALELKNLDHKRLSELTGVPERYIWAIQNMEIDKLPPSPYVRGYIKKISETLHVNHDELWELYSRELKQSTSGKYDKLPANRFAIIQPSRNKQILIILGIIIALYLIMNIGRIRGEPKLEIINPSLPVTTAYYQTFVLAGRTERYDKLTINGKEIFVNQDGSFSEGYELQPGSNAIEFKSKKLLGMEKTVTKQIFYQPSTIIKK
ncbi:MAG: helix-turn-helix domain-containing protein [Patescibacteria group bacterium]